MELLLPRLTRAKVEVPVPDERRSEEYAKGVSDDFEKDQRSFPPEVESE